MPESGTVEESLVHWDPIQEVCLFVFLFCTDLHPVPTFDGLYFEWYPVWSDKDSNSQQLLGPTTHTGLWDISPL